MNYRNSSRLLDHLDATALFKHECINIKEIENEKEVK